MTTRETQTGVSALPLLTGATKAGRHLADTECICRDGLVHWVSGLLRTEVAPISDHAALSAATRAEVSMLGYFETYTGDEHSAYLKSEAGWTRGAPLPCCL